MIKEMYCSYELSKLLKEKGFKESTQLVWYEHLPSQNAVHNSEIGKPKRDYFYWGKEGERNSPWTNDSPIPSYISGEVYSSPTYQMAMAWLREIHGVFIVIEPHTYDYVNEKYANYTFSIWQGDNYDENPLSENFPSYDEAVEAACLYVLNNLI